MHSHQKLHQRQRAIKPGDRVHLGRRDEPYTVVASAIKNNPVPPFAEHVLTLEGPDGATIEVNRYHATPLPAESTDTPPEAA